MTRLVALDLPGGESFVRHVVDIWSMGDAVLPIDQRLPPAAKTRLLELLGAHEVIDATGHASLATGRALESGDALVIATSGSTGDPKGVVHTHSSIAASSRASIARLNGSSSDHWLACLPLAHIGGFSIISRALACGASLTVRPAADPDSIAAAARSGCNRTSLVPTLLGRVDVTPFETVLIGGGRPPIDRPANVIATYGLTETGSGVVYDGWALDGVELSIGDEDEVLVRGPMLMRGYRDGITSIDAGGWLHTRDSGSLDRDGRLSVSGRLDDLIKTGGEKVWPEQVERVLDEHYPDRSSCIVGVPDAEWGESVVLVTDRPGLVLDEVRGRIKEYLPARCAPKRIVVADTPRTTNGKIRRLDARAIAERALDDAD
ncbi:MAG: AMP-dependent synthetase [Acidimicrobiales bacterium mtb01]|nr:AMP-binding protein [Actinomycetota bacterium]TEX45343.1 MAG: AMP-dependent synthetase [Acidimicrobiales bacterium mtb01]